MTSREVAAELHRQCRSPLEGERQAGYEALGRVLYRVLRQRVGADPRREHLAADCAQEALVTIWRKLSAGAGPDDEGSFLAWAMRIALNELVDAMRRLEPTSSVRPTRRVALSRLSRLDAPADDDERLRMERVPDPTAADAEASAEKSDLRALLLGIGAADAISEASRTVLLRGFLEDWSDAELAEHLGTTKANVHVIRCRDLAKLRRDDALLRRLRGHLS